RMADRETRTNGNTRRGRDGSVVHEGTVVEYAVVRSRRRQRTLSLTLDAAGLATVAVPMATTHAEIQRFVARHPGWVILRRSEIAATPPPPPLESGASLLFLGEPITLQVEDAPGARARVALEGDSLRVAVPSRIEGVEREGTVRRLVQRWYRAQAAAHFMED